MVTSASRIIVFALILSFLPFVVQDDRADASVVEQRDLIDEIPPGRRGIEEEKEEVIKGGQPNQQKKPPNIIIILADCLVSSTLK